jgi:hypothetical protein
MADFEDKVKAAFDAEFERTRPRPGLRGRVIANAVGTPRTRQRGFGAWLTPPRLALVGAAAAVLVVAGVGLRVATQGAPPVAKTSPTPSPAVLAFGKLPPPGLHPPIGLGAGGGSTPTILPYFGPATMTWSGQLPQVPSSAAVFRFTLPTTADDDAFAARLGAKLQSPGVPGEPRTYRGPDGYMLSIGADPVAQEPTYRLVRQSGPSPNQPFSEAAARAAADVEMARLGLTPTWQAAVQVSRLNQSTDQPLIFVVQYQRLIPLSSASVIGEVDGNGDPSGARAVVDSGGHILEIFGSLRLAEQSASYPLRAPSAVVNAAVSATPVTNESGPVPAVALTHVALVYTTVESGGIGYLEPAYLFTGTFSRDGQTFEKRVLIPAVVPIALAS